MEIRTKKILAGLVGLGLMILIIFVLTSGNKPPVVNDTEGTSGAVFINDSSHLQEILFDQQYYSVQAGISDYIVSKFSRSVKSAEIVGEPVIPDDGLIRIQVNIKNPDKEFTVTIDRATYFDKIVLSVPETKYKKTINVYENISSEQKVYD